MSKREELAKIKKEVEGKTEAYKEAKSESRKIDRERRQRDLEKEHRRAGTISDE